MRTQVRPAPSVALPTASTSSPPLGHLRPTPSVGTSTSLPSRPHLVQSSRRDPPRDAPGEGPRRARGSSITVGAPIDVEPVACLPTLPALFPARARGAPPTASASSFTQQRSSRARDPSGVRRGNSIAQPPPHTRAHASASEPAQQNQQPALSLRHRGQQSLPSSSAASQQQYRSVVVVASEAPPPANRRSQRAAGDFSHGESTATPSSSALPALVVRRRDPPAQVLSSPGGPSPPLLSSLIASSGRRSQRTPAPTATTSTPALAASGSGSLHSASSFANLRSAAVRRQSHSLPQMEPTQMAAAVAAPRAHGRAPAAAPPVGTATPLRAGALAPLADSETPTHVTRPIALARPLPAGAAPVAPSSPPRSPRSGGADRAAASSSGGPSVLHTASACSPLDDVQPLQPQQRQQLPRPGSNKTLTSARASPPPPQEYEQPPASATSPVASRAGGSRSTMTESAAAGGGGSNHSAGASSGTSARGTPTPPLSAGSGSGRRLGSATRLHMLHATQQAAAAANSRLLAGGPNATAVPPVILSASLHGGSFGGGGLAGPVVNVAASAVTLPSGALISGRSTASQPQRSPPPPLRAAPLLASPPPATSFTAVAGRSSPRQRSDVEAALAPIAPAPQRTASPPVAPSPPPTAPLPPPPTGSPTPLSSTLPGPSTERPSSEVGASTGVALAADDDAAKIHYLRSHLVCERLEIMMRRLITRMPENPLPALAAYLQEADASLFRVHTPASSLYQPALAHGPAPSPPVTPAVDGGASVASCAIQVPSDVALLHSTDGSVGGAGDLRPSHASLPAMAPATARRTTSLSPTSPAGAATATRPPLSGAASAVAWPSSPTTGVSRLSSAARLGGVNTVPMAALGVSYGNRVSERDDSNRSDVSAFSMAGNDMAEFLSDFRAAHHGLIAAAAEGDGTTGAAAVTPAHAQWVTLEQLGDVVDRVYLPLPDGRVFAELFEEMDPDDTGRVVFEGFLARMAYRLQGRYSADVVAGYFTQLVHNHAAATTASTAAASTPRRQSGSATAALTDVATKQQSANAAANVAAATSGIALHAAASVPAWYAVSEGLHRGLGFRLTPREFDDVVARLSVPPTIAGSGGFSGRATAVTFTGLPAGPAAPGGVSPSAAQQYAATSLAAQLGLQYEITAVGGLPPQRTVVSMEDLTAAAFGPSASRMSNPLPRSASWVSQSGLGARGGSLADLASVTPRPDAQPLQLPPLDAFGTAAPPSGVAAPPAGVAGVVTPMNPTTIAAATTSTTAQQQAVLASPYAAVGAAATPVAGLFTLGAMTTTSTHPVTLADFVRILNVVAAVMQATALQQSSQQQQPLYAAAAAPHQQQPYALAASPAQGAAVAAAASSAQIAAIGGHGTAAAAALASATPTSAAGSGLKLVAAAGYHAGGSLYHFPGAHAYSVGSAALELCDLGAL